MRLISYNIHKGVGGRDRRYRLARVVEVLRLSEADFCCLQEVTRDAARSRHDDQPKLLAEGCRAHFHRFQMNVHYRRGGYGNLLLSRWPIEEYHALSLRMREKKPRGAQVARITTPEGPLVIINWHLGLAEVERQWQVRHLLEHPALEHLAELPLLVAGDFNDWRNTLAHGPLHAHQFEAMAAPPSRFRSFPAWLPIVGLDKGFFRGAVRVDHVSVPNNVLTRQASDHLPLVIDFGLKPDENNLT